MLLWMPSVRQFVDSKGLLSLNLTRSGDNIHLGVKGIARYVRCVKEWIFYAEKCDKQRRGRSLTVKAGKDSSNPA